MFDRVLPLKALAKSGRYGASTSAPGVRLQVLHPIGLVTVIARKGKSKSVQSALSNLQDVAVMEAGIDQWYVQGPDNKLATALKQQLADTASVIDQSHGRVTLIISGPKCRAVLAKGTPVDLHANQFAIGQSAMTTMAHVGVHLTRTADDEFTLSVFRGFSESFWEWLTASAAEFGYQIS